MRSAPSETMDSQSLQLVDQEYDNYLLIDKNNKYYCNFDPLWVTCRPTWHFWLITFSCIPCCFLLMTNRLVDSLFQLDTASFSQQQSVRKRKINNYKFSLFYLSVCLSLCYVWLDGCSRRKHLYCFLQDSEMTNVFK